MFMKVLLEVHLGLGLLNPVQLEDLLGRKNSLQVGLRVRLVQLAFLVLPRPVPRKF